MFSRDPTHGRGARGTGDTESRRSRRDLAARIFQSAREVPRYDRVNESREARQPCPSCGFDLRDSIAGGGKRCPKCDRRFRLTDVGQQPQWLDEHDLRCPSCQYDLRGTVISGLKRCPECGRRFRLSQFGHDHAHRVRSTGRFLIAFAVVWLAVVVVILCWMLVRPFQAF